MGVEMSRRTPRRATTDTGFSLVEVLVAAVLFLVIVLGILPLFVQSTINNSSGRDVSRVTNEGKSRLEELIELDLDHADLEITAGDERVIEEYWSRADEVWKDGTPTDADPADYTRVTRVRQFNLNDLDGDEIFDEPLAAGALDGSVHLKELLVTVETQHGDGPLGPRRRLAMRVLKQ